MARVFGIHLLELQPGVDEAAFEKFVKEKFAPLFLKYEPRQITYLLKGDRGARAGKYAFMIEIESVEARDDIYPAEGQLSENMQQAAQESAAILQELSSYIGTFPVDSRYITDYVVC